MWAGEKRAELAREKQIGNGDKGNDPHVSKKDSSVDGTTGNTIGRMY